MSHDAVHGGRHPHHPRAELAQRLMEVAELDPRLLLALAVNEARQPGYYGCLLAHAHLIAASLSVGEDFASPQSIVLAVDRALEGAAPKRVLATPNADSNPASERAMLELMKAQVELHSTSGRFDRRVFPRLGGKLLDHFALEPLFTPEAWSY